MATWKKIITSGSAAALSSVTLDTDLEVAHGGTGASTLTSGGVLFGNGASAISAVDLSAEGNIIVGGGTPAVVTGANLAGTNLSATTGNGTLVLNVDDAFLTNTGDDATTGTLSAAGLTSTTSITSSGDISGSSTSTGSFGAGYFSDRIGVGDGSYTHPAIYRSNDINKNTGIYFGAEDQIDFASSGQRAFHLTSTYVQSEAAYSFAIYHNAGGSATYPTYAFKSDANTGMYRAGTDQLGFSTNSTLALNLDSSQNATFAGNVDSTGNYISTGANAKISGSATSTGSFGSVHVADKVGIGTTGPSSSLEVVSGSNTIIRATSTKNDNSWVADQVVGGFEVYGHDTNDGGVGVKVAIRGLNESGVSGGGKTGMAFYTTNTTNDQERLRIDMDGNVEFKAANALISGSSTSTGSFGAGHFDGKVGIGTTNPKGRLSVHHGNGEAITGSISTLGTGYGDIVSISPTGSVNPGDLCYLRGHTTPV